ncbi:hypothetical protein Bca52824_047320 [Brassica carinata]|uniref:Uncharacterized protein n=1 Tax=Brassica carinata TaxID=52824 RepID=A0A8X7US06_BRACI|nr:hypothetical protein Bca52824_047320 [Brassica carinata]
MKKSVTRLFRSSLSLSLSLSKALFDERRFDVSFGDFSRRLLLRCLSSATSPPVVLLGDLSLWFSSRRQSSLSVALLKLKVCWFSLSVGLLLQAFPRWLKSKLSPQIESSGSKRKRVGKEQSFQSSASMPSVNREDEATARPIGVKASKAKAKISVGEEGKNLQDFQQMWELKANDIAAKEKLSQTVLLDKLLAKTEPLSELEVALKNKLIKDMLSIWLSCLWRLRLMCNISKSSFEMNISSLMCSNTFLSCLMCSNTKRIVCGLSARGIIPPLSQEDRDDDVAPLPQEDTVKVVEISDEEEEDMVELSSEEYMSNMRYLIRVEESEDDIEPEFRRMLERMHEEEKKLREEKFKVLKSGIKIEKGQSSKGDGNKRKRRR